MNGDRRAFEELSAYVDGEACDPRRVKERIAGDPAYAREHAALRRLSACVRALPAPEPRPGFASRVIAAVQAEPTRTARAVWPWRVAMAGVAAIALGAGIAFYAWTPEPEPVAGVTAARGAADSRWQNEDEIVAALEQLADAGDDLSLFEPLPGPAEPLDDAAVATVFDSLLVAAWEDETLSPYAETQDVSTLIESLDTGEEDVMREVTGNFTKGAWAS